MNPNEADDPVECQDIKESGRQAKESNRSVDAEAQFIIKTWFDENLANSVKIGQELGKQLGTEMASALDQAFTEFARSEKKDITVRVRSVTKPKRGAGNR